MYTIHLARTAQKGLDGLPTPARNRVLLALTALEKEPFSGKKLKGKLHGVYSLRVWPYRIIYKIHKHDKTLLVIKIAHRQGVYA